METTLFPIAFVTEKRSRPIVGTTRIWIQTICPLPYLVVVSDDALENSFASVVQQRSPSTKLFARRREVRAVQETTVELGDEGVVEVVTPCAAVAQDVDEFETVAVVVVGGEHYCRYESRTVEWRPFTVRDKHVCRTVFELSAEVNGRLFALSKRPSACCGLRAKRSRAFVLFVCRRRGRGCNLG